MPSTHTGVQPSEKTLKTMSVSDFRVSVRPHVGFLEVSAMGPEASRVQSRASGGVAETLWEVGRRGELETTA